MFSVIHGGVDINLRKKSLDFLTSLSFDGHAIGGSLGKDRNEMFELLKTLMPLLPRDKPNHLLGIGDAESIDSCVIHGVDSFDSACKTLNVFQSGMFQLFFKRSYNCSKAWKIVDKSRTYQFETRN